MDGHCGDGTDHLPMTTIISTSACPHANASRVLFAITCCVFTTDSILYILHITYICVLPFYTILYINKCIKYVLVKNI